MKKILCLILCLAMMMTIGVAAFALSRPTFDLDPQEVKDFKALVEAISDPVTLADKEAIEAAEAACDALIAELGETKCSLYKTFTNSRAKLEAARAAYDVLVAEQGDSETDEGTPIDPSGDGTFFMMAILVLSATALVVLTSKKKVF